MRNTLIIFCYFLCCNPILSQIGNAGKIKGLPTDEVYDLFSDSRGYLWVGHSLGISRYDGHSFTHFSSPDQTTLGTSGICEDKQGRIWCYNFNGQLFYIENEQMQLFTAYNTSEDMSFPAMVILDSELVVTLEKGLFVCNTATLKCKRYFTDNEAKTDRSICLFNNSVITGIKQIYKYSHTNGFTQIPVTGSQGVEFNSDSRLTLAPLNTSDTMFAFNNQSSQLFKIIERNDSLVIVNTKKTNSVINTIVKYNDTVWINTKRKTYSINGERTLNGQNLTDLVKDKMGNTWFSSLQEGLKGIPGYIGWQKKELSLLPKGDFIRCMINWKDKIIYGTQGGKVMIFHNDRFLTSFLLPGKCGSIENLFMLPNNRLVIAPSLGLYVANIEHHKLYKISEVATLKSLTMTDSSMLLAYAQTLAKMPLTPFLKKNFTDTGIIKDDSVFEKEFKKGVKDREVYLKDTRCYFVNYDPTTRKTFVIFKSGLAEIINDSIYPVLFEGNRIRATCLLQNNNMVFAGTLNNGFFIKSLTGIEKISTKQGLSSNTIIKMKLFGSKLLLIEPGYMQVWDIAKRKFTTTIPLPGEDAGTVYDFLQHNNLVFLTFANTLYELRLTEQLSLPPPAYLLSVLNNGSNIVINNMRIPFKENTIKLLLSSPSYTHPEATYFMYRLVGTNDSNWQKLNGPVYSISFASLNPGTYKFEAYSINFEGDRSKNLLVFNFSINKPWWQQWWFITLNVVFVSLVTILLFLQRIKNIKRRDRLVIEKLTLQNELRKSLLRTIITQMNPHFIFNALNTIQGFVYRNDKESVSNYLGKFSELIRKILDTSNVDALTLEEEIEILELYLDLEKVRFEKNLQIHLNVKEQLDPSMIKIPPMFIQPYVENAIKHGLFHKKGARNLYISIDYDSYKKEYIQIVVEDDGIGRKRSSEINSNLLTKHKSFAMSALENRIDLINQTLEKKITVTVTDKINDSGTIVIIKLPVISSEI